MATTGLGTVDMISEVIQNLVDVIALSKKQCAYPIGGRLAYATPENFVGRIINGYSADASDVCLMTTKAANALCQVQNHLLENNQMGLFIYDAYRPLRAVKDFAQWFHQPIVDEAEIIRKHIHYPNLEKIDLMDLGYVAQTVSKHNFGYAVDLTLIDIKTKQQLNMGACFDFFDEISHVHVQQDRIGAEAYKNRMILSEAMQRYRFMPYEYEFWHFEHEIHEIDDPIDIPITAELKALG